MSHVHAAEVAPAPRTEPVPLAALTRPGPGAALWLAPLLSAALLYLSFFPAAVGWLAWVAFVPFLALARLPGRPRRLYLAAFLAGAVFNFPALSWFRVAHPAMYIAWVALAIRCAFDFPIALLVTRFLLRRTALPMTLIFPAVWVAGEYVRWGIFGGFATVLLGTYQHDIPGGFSWYFLGHSQHDFLEVIQIADLTGAYGVSFLVAAFNALLFEALWARPWYRRLFGAEGAAGARPIALLGQALACSALLFAALGYGAFRLSQDVGRPGPLLALMQTNVPQAVRNEGSSGEERGAEAREKQVKSFASLMGLAASTRPDLIVTPETAYPGYWRELGHGRPAERSQELALAVTRHARAPILLGMGAEVVNPDGPDRSYNSAVLLDARGRWQGRYDKIHLVPFGEYVPVQRFLPFLRGLVPYDFDYAVLPGESFTRFNLPVGPEKYTFGVLICYEDTDPMLTRAYARGEAPADFLLNVSNDGWFTGTSEHEQHLATCRFRAVESRRPVARAVNTGISAVIDANGRVRRPERQAERGGAVLWSIPENAGPLPVSEWHRYKDAGGILLARVPLDGRASFYAQHGDWFAAGCLVAAAAAAAWGRLRGRREVGHG